MQRQIPRTPIPAEYEQLRDVSKRRWKPIWRQRLITAIVLSSDVLLAFLVWKVAYSLNGIWGRGAC